MDINYELYKVFYYVADTLSFSEASKQLFISQSAVSQSIKALEKKLDQILFIRSTKKVQLTPEGEILLRHIEPAINLIKRGESQIMETASTGGQIRIGVAGRGFYQEWGKEPVEILPGDVINIPTGVKHWHGAVPDSWFSHLAVEVPGVNTSNEWLEPVKD